MPYHIDDHEPPPSVVEGRNKKVMQVCVWDEATNEIVMARWQGDAWMYDSQVKRCQEHMKWWDFAPQFSEQEMESVARNCPYHKE